MTSLEIHKGKGIEDLVGYTPKVEEARQITAESGSFQEIEVLYREKIDPKLGWNYAAIMDNVTQVLTPKEINLFLQTTMKHEDHRNYVHNTGIFIAKLIQNSYNPDYNEFILDTTKLQQIHRIGYDVRGTPEKPIVISIIGNTGSNYGAKSRNATFNVTGNIGESCGFSSAYSIFKTSNKETLDKMLYSVSSGNRIIFIQDGKEEIVRDYAD